MQRVFSTSAIPQSDEVLSWVGKTIERVFSEPGKESIAVFERDLELQEIPYWVFDSTIKDLHFFTKTNGYIMGLGVAKKWQLFPGDEVRTHHSFLTEELGEKVWIFGGWSFPEPQQNYQSSEDLNWKEFPRSEWSIPAVTLVSEEGKARLIMAINVENSTEQRTREYYETLVKILLGTAERESDRTLPARILAQNIPEKEKWVEQVKSTLDAISKGEFQKVVLARSLKLVFASPIPLATVLRNLVESSAGATVFAIRKGEQEFVGATPENLLSMRNGKLEVDCLAASAPRGINKELDDSLGHKLLNDPKARCEQKLVVDQVIRSLSTISDEILVSGEPVLKKLPHVQHLHSTVRAKLRPGVNAWKAAEVLWPTPATCGEPREASLGWIRSFEGITRGWYSGIVGYVNGDCADLYVALRSGLIRGNSALLFAGSGIVPGSDPQKEFEEADWKMKTMLNALTLE